MKFLELLTTTAIATLSAYCANAATWERPAGAYTPTNHSVNITKYQTDSANGTTISSAKVDGDINKAFQGLNDLEGRTPPSVIGNSGKFLTNNGSVTSWGNVISDSMVSGTSSIFVNGATSTISFTTAGSTQAYITSGGLLVSTGVSATSITGTNVFGTTVSAGRVSGTNISGTLADIGTVRGSVSGTTVTATNITLSGTALSLSAFAKAWVNIDGNSGATALRSGFNISAVTRRNTGLYDVSFTVALANATYSVVCISGQPSTGAAPKIYGVVDTPSQTTAGFMVTGGSAGGAE